jgi:hypothetical protein
MHSLRARSLPYPGRHHNLSLHNASSRPRPIAKAIGAVQKPDASFTTSILVILSNAKDLQFLKSAHNIQRERPKEANQTNCATGASAWMANP